MHQAARFREVRVRDSILHVQFLHTAAPPQFVFNDVPAATTNFISNSATGHADATVAAGDPMTISVSNSVIDPGAGSHTISFIAGASADTLVLHADGVDVVSGFNPGGDVLDLSSLLSEAKLALNGDIAVLGNYVSIADQGSDAVVMLDATGHVGGTAVALLLGLGAPAPIWLL